MSPHSSEWKEATKAIRAGPARGELGEHSEPICLTSSFVFKNAEEAAARFSGSKPGYIYSRFTNPTVKIFEERLALMEGGERCIATSSGMSAILTLCLSVLEAGDHIVAARDLFGTTINLFNHVLKRFAITTTFVPLSDYVAWERAITPKTKILFLETPSNPLTEIADISRLAALSHRHGILLVVDNCFATPVLQKPLALGADIIIHSATKYLDGQGRCVGGAIVGSEALLGDKVFPLLRTSGPSMSPFNAWVFIKGLETLTIRMQAVCTAALKIAEWLTTTEQVTCVHYPGLNAHPQHALAKTQQSGFGGIISFEVAGGREAAWRFINRLALFSITANLGDTKSTITHPASTTHHRLTEEQRRDAGIAENLLRLSIGLEDVSDLIDDLKNGLVAR